MSHMAYRIVFKKQLQAIWKIQGEKFWRTEKNKVAQKKGLLDSVQTKIFCSVDVEENEK